MALTVISSIAIACSACSGAFLFLGGGIVFVPSNFTVAYLCHSDK